MAESYIHMLTMISYAYNDCVAALIEPKAMDDHFNALQLLTARPVLRKPEQGRKV